MTEPFLLRAALAGVVLAVVAAPLGCFVVWRRMAYFGETVSQACLIGVALGLAFDLNLTVSALVGAVGMAGLLTLLSGQRVVPIDATLGLLAHAALAVGVIAMSLARGGAVDLNAYLFGDIFAVTTSDVWTVVIGGGAVLALLTRLWEPLLRSSVHEDLAAAEGVNIEVTRAGFVLLLALVIAIAMKVVGILLAIAFLIMPAVAARPFAVTPERMAVLAALVGAGAVVAGLGLSLTMDTPGGPSIVVMMALAAAVAIASGSLRRNAVR